MTGVARAHASASRRPSAAFVLIALMLIVTAGGVAGLGGVVGAVSIVVGVAIIAIRTPARGDVVSSRTIAVGGAGQLTPAIVLGIDGPETLRRLQSAGWTIVEPPLRVPDTPTSTSVRIRGDFVEIETGNGAPGVPVRLRARMSARDTKGLAECSAVMVYAFDARQVFDRALHERRLLGTAAFSYAP